MSVVAAKVVSLAAETSGSPPLAGDPPRAKTGKADAARAATRPVSYRQLIHWTYLLVRMAQGLFLASTALALAAILLTQVSIQLLANILSDLRGGATDVAGVQSEVFFYIALTVVLIGVQFGGKLITGWSDTQMVVRLQQRLHDTLLTFSGQYHDRHELGELTSVVLQSSGGAQQMLREFAAFPVLRGVPLVTAVMLLTHNLRKIQTMPAGSELIIGLGLLALPLVGSRLSGRLRGAAGVSQTALNDLNSEFVNSLGQPLEVQVLGAQRQRAMAFGASLRRMRPGWRPLSV